jgi:hypothetical protein
MFLYSDKLEPQSIIHYRCRIDKLLFELDLLVKLDLLLKHNVAPFSNSKSSIHM